MTLFPGVPAFATMGRKSYIPDDEKRGEVGNRTKAGGHLSRYATTQLRT